MDGHLENREIARPGRPKPGQRGSREIKVRLSRFPPQPHRVSLRLFCMEMPLMTRKFALLLLVAAALSFGGCNKINKLTEKVPFLKKKEAVATPAPAPVAATEPTPAAAAEEPASTS